MAIHILKKTIDIKNDTEDLLYDNQTEMMYLFQKKASYAKDCYQTGRTLSSGVYLENEGGD